MDETQKLALLQDIDIIIRIFDEQALTREEALTRTKLQEAELWLKESMRT